MRRTGERHHEFDGFNDPVVKILLGIGIALTLMLYVAVLLKPLIGVAGFLVMLESIAWALGAYAVFGTIFGLVRGIQYRNRRRSHGGQGSAAWPKVGHCKR